MPTWEEGAQNFPKFCPRGLYTRLTLLCLVNTEIFGIQSYLLFFRSPSRKQAPPIESTTDEVSFDIVIPNEIGPLGVHVVPCDTDGRLIVQGIEPGGRIDRDGRLAVSDCIVAINGYPLQVNTFTPYFNSKYQ